MSIDGLGVFHVTTTGDFSTEPVYPQNSLVKELNSISSFGSLGIVVCFDRMHIVNLTKIGDIAVQFFPQFGDDPVFNQFGRIDKGSSRYQFPVSPFVMGCKL